MLYTNHIRLLLISVLFAALTACGGGGGSGGTTATSPVFSSSAAASVSENTTVIGYSASATDADGDTVTFTLTGGADQAKFNINAGSGVLSFNLAPDFEVPTDSDTNNSYLVEITATDGTNVVALTVTISVTDLNDNTPIFTSGAAISVTEATVATGYTAAATDADGDTVTFSLTGGTDQTAFSIDANSGVLTFQSAPSFATPGDSDTNNTYVVELTANDGINTVAQTVTVTVTMISSNVAPTSTPGVNQYVLSASPVVFDGSASTDSDGSIASYAWTQTAGTTVTLTGASTDTINFTAPTVIKQTVLVFQLTVTDNEAASNVATAYVVVVPAIVNSPLNDTGVTFGNNFPNGTNATCIGETVTEQDCSFGRDMTNNDDSDGIAGFSFTKRDSSGTALVDQTVAYGTTPWHCVQDNITGLTWEVKTNDGGHRDRDHTFTWYNSTGINDGGVPGTPNGGVCVDSVNCDIEKYVAAVNAAGLCGFNDWRVPSIYELRSIHHRNLKTTLAVDVAFFVNTTNNSNLDTFYWSSTPSVTSLTGPWGVWISGGNADSFNFKHTDAKSVRLVR